MLYTRPTFTCPSAGPRVTEKNWDRAFLPKDVFVAKYGETPELEVKPFSVEPESK